MRNGYICFQLFRDIILIKLLEYVPNIKMATAGVQFVEQLTVGFEMLPRRLDQ